jgi:hypothetical protein
MFSPKISQKAKEIKRKGVLYVSTRTVEEKQGHNDDPNVF